jgi:AcrR family transcriptional regulator
MNGVHITTRDVNMVQAKSERRSNLSRPATALRHQGLRDELLATATRMIEATGLAQLRTRDLAAAAGCSVGAIYNIFADLDQLVLAVNASTLRAISAAMAGIAGDNPTAQLRAMADAYLDYAATHRRLWDALFNHSMPLEAPRPDWFQAVQDAAFSHIEHPLAALRPDLGGAECRLLGRSIFAAVHGMVALGLDNRLAPMDLTLLRAQIGLVVGAIITGLSA